MTDQSERQATRRINHDGYIELRFTEVSRQAVDDLVAHLVDIVEENTTQQSLRIFVSNGTPRAQSISYLLGQLRQYKDHFVVSYPIRIAANFNMMLIANLVEIFLKSMPNSTIEFKGFPNHDNDMAVAWLLEGENKPTYS